ncbi:hypothetical protein [Streptomyces sp. NPDC001091]
MVRAILDWFGQLWTRTKQIFTDLKNGVVNLWNGLWKTVSDRWSSFWLGLKTGLSNAKNGLTQWVSGLRTTITNTWNNLWNATRDKVTSIFSTINTKISNFRKGMTTPSAASETPSAASGRASSLASPAPSSGSSGTSTTTASARCGTPSPERSTPSFRCLPSASASTRAASSPAPATATPLVIGGLKSAAQKAISSLVRPLINSIPGGGFGSLLKGLSNKALDGMLGFLGNEDKKAVGGPAVQRAVSWVKTQNGLPYQWAGNGNRSWDCSGLMSAIESVIRGERPHRRWATGAFVGNSGPAGWVCNLKSPFMVGITNAGVGHTAGTLAGMNVESSGGAGVHMGKSARGYNDRMFTSQWGFAPAAKYDSGGLLQPGATMAINKTGKPEAVLTADEHAAFRSLVTRLSGGGFSEGVNINVSVEVRSMTIPTPAEARRFAQAIADPVKEEIRKLDRSRR